MLETSKSLTKKLQKHPTKQTARRKRRPGNRKQQDSYAVFHENLRLLGFRSYREYLHSDIWKTFNHWYRSSGLPQYCLICRATNFVLHHRSYMHLGYEDLADVIPLCESHHTELHKQLKSSKVNLGDVVRQFDEFFDVPRKQTRRMLAPFYKTRRQPKRKRAPKKQTIARKKSKPVVELFLCPQCNKDRRKDWFYGSSDICKVCVRRNAKQEAKKNKPKRSITQSALRRELSERRKFSRASAEGNFGPVGPSNAEARAIPTNGEIGRHETGASLAKGRRDS